MKTTDRRSGWFLPLVFGLSACGTTYREVRFSEPVQAVADGLHLEVARAFLNDEVLEDGVGEDTALIVELTASNAGPQPWIAKVSAFWCLLQVDTALPDQTLLLPPSVDGEGSFTGPPPEPPELKPIEVPAGQTRSFWVLFRGYRFAGSEIQRRVTLDVPGIDGRPIVLTLADPARGFLRWKVAPTGSAYLVGLQNDTFYGSYLQANTTSMRFSRIATAGPLLWDVGFSTTVLVETQGRLRSPTSSFSNLGLDAYLSAPIWRWGAVLDPRRIGLYAGAEVQVLTAVMPPAQPGVKQTPIVYGAFDPEVGLELDVGALRTAATPFPLDNAGRNPIPRWQIRYGYTHSWIGHGTSDGLVSSFRLVW
ncbi:MAG TPA: hypothetical protein VFG23_03740 [Polyangia bacterium]|nr:hypothetical protein [Polyangia bacterium]